MEEEENAVQYLVKASCVSVCLATYSYSEPKLIYSCVLLFSKKRLNNPPASPLTDLQGRNGEGQEQTLLADTQSFFKKKKISSTFRTNFASVLQLFVPTVCF